jgi:multiple sugar transport system substrate-binding protein
MIGIPNGVARRVKTAGLAVATFAMIGGSSALAAGKVTIWVGSWWEPQVSVIQEMWKKDHADTTLDIQPLPINGYLDKFTAATLAGSPPDIVDLDTSWVSTVAAQGLVQPLDDLVGKLNVKDISPAVWNASRFKGKQYAIPMRSGPGVYYYNKTVFDRAKVPYPTSSWTYADFLDIAKKLTIPGVQYGIGVPADASDPSNVTTMFAPILWAMGGDFLTADETKPAINSPQSVKAIQFWADLYLKHKVAPEGTPNFTTTRDLQPLFEANKVGMLTSSSNTFDSFSQKPDLKWGVVLSPETVNRGGGWTMSVPAGARNAEGAKLFLLWLSKPETMAKALNRFPANVKALELPPWNDPAKAIFKDAEAGGRSVPSVAGWFQMQEALIIELQRILVGQKTAQQAADAAAAKMAEIIAANK